MDFANIPELYAPERPQYDSNLPLPRYRAPRQHVVYSSRPSFFDALKSVGNILKEVCLAPVYLGVYLKEVSVSIWADACKRFMSEEGVNNLKYDFCKEIASIEKLPGLKKASQTQENPETTKAGLLKRSEYISLLRTIKTPGSTIQAKLIIDIISRRRDDYLNKVESAQVSTLLEGLAIELERESAQVNLASEKANKAYDHLKKPYVAFEKECTLFLAQLRLHNTNAKLSNQSEVTAKYVYLRKEAISLGLFTHYSESKNDSVEIKNTSEESTANAFKKTFLAMDAQFPSHRKPELTEQQIDSFVTGARFSKLTVAENKAIKASQEQKRHQTLLRDVKSLEKHARLEFEHFAVQETLINELVDIYQPLFKVGFTRVTSRSATVGVSGGVANVAEVGGKVSAVHSKVWLIDDEGYPAVHISTGLSAAVFGEFALSLLAKVSASVGGGIAFGEYSEFPDCRKFVTYLLDELIEKHRTIPEIERHLSRNALLADHYGIKPAVSLWAVTRDESIKIGTGKKEHNQVSDQVDARLSLQKTSVSQEDVSAESFARNKKLVHIQGRSRLEEVALEDINEFKQQRDSALSALPPDADDTVVQQIKSSCTDQIKLREKELLIALARYEAANKIKEHEANYKNGNSGGSVANIRFKKQVKADCDLAIAQIEKNYGIEKLTRHQNEEIDALKRTKNEEVIAEKKEDRPSSIAMDLSEHAFRQAELKVMRSYAVAMKAIEVDFFVAELAHRSTSSQLCGEANVSIPGQIDQSLMEQLENELTDKNDLIDRLMAARKRIIVQQNMPSDYMKAMRENESEIQAVKKDISLLELTLKYAYAKVLAGDDATQTGRLDRELAARKQEIEKQFEIDEARANRDVALTILKTSWFSESEIKKQLREEALQCESVIKSIEKKYALQNEAVLESVPLEMPKDNRPVISGLVDASTAEPFRANTIIVTGEAEVEAGIGIEAGAGPVNVGIDASAGLAFEHTHLYINAVLRTALCSRLADLTKSDSEKEGPGSLKEQIQVQYEGIEADLNAAWNQVKLTESGGEIAGLINKLAEQGINSEEQFNGHLAEEERMLTVLKAGFDVAVPNSATVQLKIKPIEARLNAVKALRAKGFDSELVQKLLIDSKTHITIRNTKAALYNALPETFWNYFEISGLKRELDELNDKTLSITEREKLLIANGFANIIQNDVSKNEHDRFALLKQDFDELTKLQASMTVRGKKSRSDEILLKKFAERFGAGTIEQFLHRLIIANAQLFAHSTDEKLKESMLEFEQQLLSPQFAFNEDYMKSHANFEEDVRFQLIENSISAEVKLDAILGGFCRISGIDRTRHHINIDRLGDYREITFTVGGQIGSVDKFIASISETVNYCYPDMAEDILEDLEDQLNHQALSGSYIRERTLLVRYYRPEKQARVYNKETGQVMLIDRPFKRQVDRLSKDKFVNYGYEVSIPLGPVNLRLGASHNTAETDSEIEYFSSDTFRYAILFAMHDYAIGLIDKVTGKMDADNYWSKVKLEQKAAFIAMFLKYAGEQAKVKEHGWDYSSDDYRYSLSMEWDAIETAVQENPNLSELDKQAFKKAKLAFIDAIGKLRLQNQKVKKEASEDELILAKVEREARYEEAMTCFDALLLEYRVHADERKMNSILFNARPIAAVERLSA